MTSETSLFVTSSSLLRGYSYPFITPSAKKAHAFFRKTTCFAEKGNAVCLRMAALNSKITCFGLSDVE